MLDRDRVEEAQPDPRPALRALHDDLARAGIRLVLVPVPDKAAVEGRYLVGGSDNPNRAVTNPDWPRFAADMRAAGLEVFDVPQPTDDGPAYLQDALDAALHGGVAQAWRVWCPSFPASGVAMHTQPARSDESVTSWTCCGCRRAACSVSGSRDLSCRLRRTRHGPQPSSDVLLLGDSFTNIYSDAAMGGGDSAGFAEHLSLALGRPLVRRNGGSAAALRLSLARVREPEPTRGQAARDLPVRHARSRRIALAGGARAGGIGACTGGRRAREIEIEGTIVQTSEVPDPATAPCASSVGMMKIAVDRVISGEFAGRELVAGFS
jgi:hypothetical protein